MTPEERFEAWVEKAYPYGAAHGRVMATAKEAYIAGFTAGAEDTKDWIVQELYKCSSTHAALVRSMVRVLPLDPNAEPQKSPETDPEWAGGSLPH